MTDVKLNWYYKAIIEKCPGYDIKLHLIMRFNSWSLRDVEYSFITIILKSTLSQSGSKVASESNRTAQFFFFLFY